MRYPTLKPRASSREMVDAFQGYNHNLRIGDGEFYDMLNMTSDNYPILSPRSKRKRYKASETINGMIAKDALCYVDGEDFVINEHHTYMRLNDEPKQLISMGSYVIILPDKKYINTSNHDDWGNIEAEFVTGGETSFTLCKLDSTEYEIRFPASSEEPKKPESESSGSGEGEGEGDTTTEPEGPKNMDLWIDTSTTPHTLKQYSESAGMWVTIPTTYVKIFNPGIGTAFEKYDGIEISGPGVIGTQAASLKGAAVVWEKADDYIVVVGILDEVVTVNAPIVISRKMPKMDFVIESENRLWGCRYGLNNNDKIVNEIYCSKLGDFKNWNCFMSLSTDSYVASVGTDGPFTGAITHMGYPLFFKENFMHKVYGSYPSNFQIQTTACQGVQKGCGKSLGIVNTTLMYKSKSGVMSYDGSLPMSVSYALGNAAYSDAVAGAHLSKYYISMKDANDIFHLFVYDASKGMWHKEDNMQVLDFCSCRGELYATHNTVEIENGEEKGITAITILLDENGSQTDNLEEKVLKWMVETGDIGIRSPDMKYISRLTIRLSMEVGSELKIFVQYDFAPEWEQVCMLTGTSLRSFSIPIRPKRCDHMKLRFEGVGMANIYSITKTIEQGSERS